MLALGNCMADWVADTVVAKSGNTQMAFASCFGSPMLSHILGLSVAFVVSLDTGDCFTIISTGFSFILLIYQIATSHFNT